MGDDPPVPCRTPSSTRSSTDLVADLAGRRDRRARSDQALHQPSRCDGLADRRAWPTRRSRSSCRRARRTSSEGLAAFNERRPPRLRGPVEARSAMDVRDDHLRGRRPRRDDHVQPARPAQRAQPADGPRAARRPTPRPRPTTTSGCSSSPARAGRSAPAPTSARSPTTAGSSTTSRTCRRTRSGRRPQEAHAAVPHDDQAGPHRGQRHLLRRRARLVTTGDIVIASDRAEFFDPHVSIGLVSGREVVRLARALPAQRRHADGAHGPHERLSAAAGLRARADHRGGRARPAPGAGPRDRRHRQPQRAAGGARHPAGHPQGPRPAAARGRDPGRDVSASGSCAPTTPRKARRRSWRSASPSGSAE